MNPILSNAYEESDALNAVLVALIGPLLMFLKYTEVEFGSAVFQQRLPLSRPTAFMNLRSNVGGNSRAGLVICFASSIQFICFAICVFVSFQHSAI